MLLFTLFVLVRSSIIYSQKDLGCLTKINGICTQLCPLGQQECSSTYPKCEYGYFQYKTTCTQCPYQTVTDVLKLYCMDCVEHPYSWKNDRKCTYEYSIESGMVGTGTFVKMTKTYTELFFIGEAVLPGNSADILPRDVNFEYAVYSCFGCKEFCSSTSLTDCNAFTSPYSEDSDKVGIQCFDGYYFSQNACNSCPNNCLSCSSSLNCNSCESGYSVAANNQGCVACPNNCLGCMYKNGQQICYSCESPLISSLSQDRCDSCGSSCDRCEYTTYEEKMKYTYPTRSNALILDQQQKYVKRCRQCSGSMTIYYNGIDCVECQIRNCEKCYYNIRGADPNYESTMDVDFKPSGAGDIPSEQLCFACSSLYYLSQDKTSCIPYPTGSITNCDKYKKVNAQIKCQLCLNNIILDQFVGGCFGLCTSYISSCQRCYSYRALDQTDYVASDGSIQTKPAQTLFQCVKCDSGYYPDFFTGLCLSCPNQCQNCWQYTPTYNLTDYLNKFQQVDNEQKEIFLNDLPILIKCSQCKSGFNLYGGICLGCTSNCQIANPTNDPNIMDDDLIASCTYKSTFAFCSECYDNFNDRSLTSDKTECHKCPQNCQACRDRSSSEKVNPYFNPTNSNLLQYGRLCFQRQTSTGDASTVVSFNTYLGLPIICVNSETQRCQHDAEITVIVYCNSMDYDNAYTAAAEADQIYIYDLSSYYEQDSESVATIDFSSLETFSLYSALNQKPVESMQLNIKFKAASDGTCTFSKDTRIQTSFQENVFALIDFKVVISSYDGNAVDLNLAGNLYLEDYSEVQLDHLNIYSSQNTNFGLVVNGTLPSKVKLSNMNFGFKVNSTTNALFSFLLSSLSVLNMDSVTFQYLKFTDVFKIDQSIMSYQQITISDLTFVYCNFQQTQLFPLIEGSVIKITGIVINQCLFIESYIFVDQSIYSVLIGTLEITQMVIKFCIFQESVMIYTSQLSKLTMDQIDIVNNRLLSTSLIVSNQYTLSNMLITNNQINQQSIIIDSIDKIQEFAVTSIKLQSIDLIKFVNNQCGDINCFIKLSSPFNLDNIQSDLILTNIYINENSIDLENSLIKSITSALIRITSIDHLKMTNMHIDNTRKITAISIQGILSLTVDGFLCDWSSPSVGTYYYNPTESIQNYSQILYATNNKLPPSSDCSDTSKALDYNQYCLYVQDFIYGVSLKNIALKRLLAIDTSFIYIQSYSSMEKQTSNFERPISLMGEFYYSQTNEVIILENVRIYNTTIGIDNPSSSLSAITIESDQLQKIQITNLKAIANHLHQLVDAMGYYSGTVMLIQSPQSNITITSSTFLSNRATQSYYGIIYLKGNVIQIYNTLFQDTNIMQSDWIDRLEENQFKSQEEMSDYFTIESFGSNLYIQSQNLIVEGCQFNNSYGQGGAGIYFVGSDVAKLIINNTKFTDMMTSLQPTDQTSGGCLYINSLYSSLSMIMNNITMTNGLARNKGGCIYIDPSLSSQSVEISDSIFIGCQSLQGQIISAEYSISSKIAPYVSFERCQFMNNRFLNFLSNLPTISESDKQIILISSGAIQQNYGYLKIQDSQFQNITHVSLLNLQNMINLIVLSTQIENCTIYVSPLIKCSMNSVAGQIKFSDVSITSTNQQSLSTAQQMLNQYNNSNCELNTAISITPTTQTCAQIEEIRQISLVIINYYLASYTLYNSTIEAIYNNLVNKYAQPTIDIDSYSSLDQFQTSTYKFTNYVYYQTFTQIEYCFLTDIYDEYNVTLSSSMYLTSILYVPTLILGNTINLTSLTIQNTNCLRCLGGLVQINSIDSKSMDSIIVQDMLCYQNIIGYYGCLMFTTDSIYKTNSVTRLLVSTRNIQILQSFFIENQAAIGAAVSLFGLTAIIQESQFLDNTASLIGGAIVMQPDSTTEPLLLSNSNFYGNKAQIAGAILLSGASLPNSSINSIQFQDNKASLFGDDSETYPQKLTIQMEEGINLPTQTYLNYTGDSDYDGLIDDTSTEIIDIINLQSYTIFSQNATTFLMLPSGQPISSYGYYYSYTEEQVPYDWIFRIIHLDQNKATIQSAASSDSCTITGRLMDKNNEDTNKTFLTNFTNINTVNFDTKIGAYDLGSLQVYFDPSFESNLYLQLRFECTSIKIPVYQSISPYSILGHNQEYSLLVNIRTLPCQLGEAKNGQKCISCSESTDTYSVKENSLQCSGINTATMIEVTPIKINLRAGYWRAQSNNDIVESCINLQENCNGGWIPGDSSCYSGHVGALCETCDINSIRGESYSISKKYTCGACSQTIQTNTLTIIAISAFTLISMIFSVRGNYQMIETFIHEQVLISIGVRIAQTSNNLSILIKLLTNYLQIITALTTFRISIPTSFVSSMEVLGNPTQSMSYSLDCFLILMTPVDILYFRMIWALLMPIIYLVIFFFGYSLTILAGKAPLKKGIIYTTFIYMFIYLQPTLVGGFISLLSSRTISGIEWVQSDVSYRYNTDTHFFWILIFIGPNLLLWAVIFPCIFMYLVRQIRDKLTEIESRKKWGYFYNEYTKGAYLWEFVKIFEKELVIIGLTYYEDKIVIKGLIVFLIVFFYGAFSYEFTPYKLKTLNKIDQLSTAVCAVSLCLGVLIYASQSENMDYLQYIMFFIIGFINGLFILYLLYNLFEGYLDKFQDLVDKLRDAIKKKYPQIEFQYPFLRKWLINRKQMKERVKYLWSFLRYETKKGINRKRQNSALPLFDRIPIILLRELSQEKELNQPKLDSKPVSRSGIHESNEEINHLNPDTPGKLFQNVRSSNSLHVLLQSGESSKSPELQKVYPLLESSPQAPQERLQLKKVRY